MGRRSWGYLWHIVGKTANSPPLGFEDQSVLAFVEFNGDTVQTSLTVAQENLGDSDFGTFMKNQVSALGKTLSGYRLVRKSEKAVAGGTAWILDQTATALDGRGMQQYQAYIPKDKTVVILTASSPKEQAPVTKMKFDGLLATFRMLEGDKK